jgi:6-phosphofructokinase 1
MPQHKAYRCAPATPGLESIVNSFNPDFAINSVRPCTIATPHRFAGRHDGGPSVSYVNSDERVLVCTNPRGDLTQSFEHAGPREQIAFDPAITTAAVLTSGGLCPGLNAVISAIVTGLYRHYGVKRVLGIPNGYAGMMPPRQKDIIPLDLDKVRGIARTGGSCLGSARVKPDVRTIVDTLQAFGIDILFTIGGDGTQRGAHAIHEEIVKRGLSIGVVGIPKTIDNDINWVDKTFGFETSVEIARQAITAANTEAESAINGIGLVKLMGRDSGFIAAAAAIAAHDVNYVLVPEVPFELEGEKGLFASLERRLSRRGHAVIVVAEGAGQELMAPTEALFDKSGNKLPQDIGTFLRDKITAHLRSRNIDHQLKYIDPSYIIRAAPANGADTIFCTALGHNAVHAAMAGKTDMIVGSWNGQLTHVPIPLAVKGRKMIEPSGELWRMVLESTGQGPLVNTAIDITGTHFRPVVPKN